jgi:hypothetical protein
MTTYTITVNGETYNANATAAQVKSTKKNLWGNTVIATKNIQPKSEPIKFWYYRNDMVSIIEERQNGWTLVHNFSKGTDVFAVTSELEYK